MSRRAAGLIATAAIVTGCGGSEESGTTTLDWVDEPALVRAATGGSDRVVIGEIRNQGSEPVELLSGQVSVRDANGDSIRSDARFVSTYLHGLYGADVAPSDLPPSERLRLGIESMLKAGESAPVFAAFRARHAEQPLTLVIGEDSLPIPGRLSTGAAEQPRSTLEP